MSRERSGIVAHKSTQMVDISVEEAPRLCQKLLESPVQNANNVPTLLAAMGSIEDEVSLFCSAAG